MRIYRAVGFDLQKLVHEDMLRSFSAYPRIWSAVGADANIDHRRVPNLMTFFRRNGRTLPTSRLSTDYAPGDIVAWDLGGGLTHLASSFLACGF